MTENNPSASKSRSSERGVRYGTAESANEDSYSRSTSNSTSNEYVLNVAFGSFSFFTAIQFVFALVANSQAMMADCGAMAVDAITYLFNYTAERIKNRNTPEKENQLHPEALQRRRKLQMLYLELIPPLVSVTTLMTVTIMSMKEAIEVLMADGTNSNPPDVVIMTVFSLLNLILDAVNVSCFARAADQLVGFPPSVQVSITGHGCHEETELLAGEFKRGNDAGDSTTYSTVSEEIDVDSTSLDMIHDDDDSRSSSPKNYLNLNMCSAWTHVCADTLRSITTLLAASFSWLFPYILSPAAADSWGAIFISSIIILSLGPLIQGIVSTAGKIRELSATQSPYRF